MGRGQLGQRLDELVGGRGERRSVVGQECLTQRGPGFRNGAGVAGRMARARDDRPPRAVDAVGIWDRLDSASAENPEQGIQLALDVARLRFERIQLAAGWSLGQLDDDLPQRRVAGQLGIGECGLRRRQLEFLAEFRVAN